MITITMVDEVTQTMCPRSAIDKLEGMKLDATDDVVIDAINEALIDAYASTMYLFN